MSLLQLRRNRKGQATAEMAIMGAVVIMLFAYLLQQGYIYNARQSLEMYTFREAARLSKAGVRNRTLYEDKGLNRAPVGINLTVIRDVVVPSFFSGLNRQRLMSSASVDLNSYIAYTPDLAQDVGSKQLIQIGEKMIRGIPPSYIEVPPTKMRIVTEGNQDQDEEAKLQWVNSAVWNIDTSGVKASTYAYTTNTQETEQDKTTTKSLAANDLTRILIGTQSQGIIARNYGDDDWTAPSDDDHIIEPVQVQPGTNPSDLTLWFDDTVTRSKTTSTAH